MFLYRKCYEAWRTCFLYWGFVEIVLACHVKFSEPEEKAYDIAVYEGRIHGWSACSYFTELRNPKEFLQCECNNLSFDVIKKMTVRSN